jgi:hypothetical protein
LPNAVIRGVGTTAATLFYQDGTTIPLIVIGGVAFTITTSNNLLVLSGVASQDPNNAARYIINFTIPKTAPITAGDDRYILKWRAASGNEIITSQEYFQVIDQADPATIDNNIVTLVGMPFTANLITPNNDLTALSLRVLNPAGTAVITLSNLINANPTLVSEPGPITPIASGNKYIYSVNVDDPDWLAGLTIQNSGLASYFTYFNYIDGSGQQTEVQPLYLANTILLNMMNDMRQYVDMLRNNDTIVELRVSDVKLLHFAFQGLLRVNATSPANFTFDFNMLPRAPQFYFWILKAAQFELLQALYLAEGMTAFDLQGMSVQLTSDRTQYISALSESIKNDLDNMLPKVKSQYARSGGFSGRIGTIGTVLGPNTNWVFRAAIGSNNWTGGLAGLPTLPFLI